MNDGKYPKKYIVILENDTGYMDCIADCNTAEEAYGNAYLQLSDGLDEDTNYYITLPETREGDNGYIIECRNKDDNKINAWCTVLFYREDGEKDD